MMIFLSVLSIRYTFYLELTSVRVVRVKDPVLGFSHVASCIHKTRWSQMIRVSVPSTGVQSVPVQHDTP